MATDPVVKVTTWGPDPMAQPDRKGNRVELRWRLHFAGGRHADRRKRFARKGLGQAHAKRLHDAEHGVVDPVTGRRWGWSAEHAPILLDGPAPVTPANGDTLWSLVCDWRAARWSTLSGNGRSTAASAWRIALAMAVVEPLGADALTYLKAVALRNGRLEPTREALQERGEVRYRVENKWQTTTPATLWRGRVELEAKSLPVERLDRTMLRRMVVELGEGRAANTERRYWSAVLAVLSWAQEEEIDGRPRVPRGLTDGIEVRPAKAQNLTDVAAVPTVEEMWTFAEACATAPHAKGRWKALPIVMGGAGLRIGECAALARRCVNEESVDGTGGMWLTVRRTIAEPGRDYTDSGEATEVRGTKRKGPHGNEEGRKTYLPPAEAAVLREHLREHVRDQRPDAPVFTGARGGRLDVASLDDLVWRPALTAAFGPDHRLAGMTRHALRHLALTRWLRAGVPLTVAARWGGWSDTAVMLRYYDSVLPQDDEYGAQIMAGAPAAAWSNPEPACAAGSS